MKVTHRTTIVCRCPVSSEIGVYDAIFECCNVVAVEDIQKAIVAAIAESAFQETITDRLAKALGVKVTTRGRHGRFETECCCE